MVAGPVPGGCTACGRSQLRRWPTVLRPIQPDFVGLYPVRMETFTPLTGDDKALLGWPKCDHCDEWTVPLEEWWDDILGLHVKCPVCRTTTVPNDPQVVGMMREKAAAAARDRLGNAQCKCGEPAEQFTAEHLDYCAVLTNPHYLPPVSCGPCKAAKTERARKGWKPVERLERLSRHWKVWAQLRRNMRRPQKTILTPVEKGLLGWPRCPVCDRWMEDYDSKADYWMIVEGDFGAAHVDQRSWFACPAYEDHEHLSVFSPQLVFWDGQSGSWWAEDPDPDEFVRADTSPRASGLENEIAGWPLPRMRRFPETE